ncbi:hypothetical protein A2209_01450 [Candidatus Roizmanbacteria bacterium RIFOXYA1_FULL_41_12]|uniref:Peptidase M10 metallopeptidase domain-containing protein n=2 Tax=Microgenomates group TaxID=1794810 RepID=A0A1F5F5G6_9BACT|nr:MAG: hypothetical protein UX32_C0031G0010 [Microgenomates group bacterium GW2011_GWF1_46_12]OGD74826.1 MAG: hypothetical protein A2228_00075 [Candidatus Collierbacteria bacterium RIFOXYA2_FULL_46_10]OGK67092.1 MAG: hypothetical protein A2209_01450 [Candidatus Roizmanbacteria bacterium RIFOXYA1_FULL_41_12]HBD02444.1 hypothetical protein [Candidatus Collierbacteria bacterium]HBO11065.1 hypothetical protein [Candidatus Collierbacteria bacterium]
MKTSLIIFFLILGSFFFTPPTTAKDEGDKGPLTKITYIHYKKLPNAVRPTEPGKTKPSLCYGYLAKGAKWKTTENYFVNPLSSALDSNFVLQSITSGVSTWEEYGGSTIFGEGVLDTSSVYNDSLPDGDNVVAFGSYPSDNVIAVTNVWGYFSGAPQTRELVEWDMLFNTRYHWGDATQNSTLMDLPNIATHELGHSAGMDDLYTTTCSTETMYGYSGEGETTKRDLNQGDIQGITNLYQ